MENPDASYDYDVFISYASEDGKFAKKMADLLRENGAAVWFDEWEIKAGDNVPRKINHGISASRKMLAIWSQNYWAEEKAWAPLETFAATAGDPLSVDRPLIPILIDHSQSQIPPLYRPLKMIYFRRKDDFHLHFNDVVNALDLEKPFQFQREDDFPDMDDRRTQAFRRGKSAHEKGDLFEKEIAQIYQLKGFTVIHHFHEGGFKFDLKLEKRDMGIPTNAVAECKNKRVTARDRDQIIAQKHYLQTQHPGWQCMAISSLGFAGDSRAALENAGVACLTYNEVLNGLFPLERYVKGQMDRYESQLLEKWEGRDRFIRPDIEIDISWKTRPALEYITEWFRDGAKNLLVLLGDLGTGKTTLAEFLAWKLGQAFLDDPSRNPAPALIPLGDMRKEVSLESMVIRHFSSENVRDVQFSHFEKLLKIGKIILLFDAFDEMADKVDWEITRSNFYDLSRAAAYRSKVLLTCRSHYFKDRREQDNLLSSSDYSDVMETEIYQSLRGQANSQVVYLKTFSDDQIMEYLRKHSENPDQDWMSIRRIHHLQGLAHRPLLLEMIVKSLPKLTRGELVNAASLYKVYTDIWIERDEGKGRHAISKDEKREIMKHLARTLWKENRATFHHKELIPLCASCAENRSPGQTERQIRLMAGEIRAATFIKRADMKGTEGDGEFRFMHRSFMEYFFALYLFDVMAKKEMDSIEEILKTRPIDQKIIYFFSQIDAENVAAGLLKKILTSSYQEMISENALRILYWSGRVEVGMERGVTDHKRLRDILEKKLPEHIQLQRARLDDEDFEGMVLTNSDLSHAYLKSSNFKNSKITGCNFSGADFTSALFQDAFLSGNNFTGAVGTREALVSASLEESKGMDEASGRALAGHLLPSLQSGHSSVVNCAAFSPDGRLVASCDADGLILIFRADDQKILRVLQGHTDEVNSIAFSPDGQTIATASDDETARIWDANSGKQTLILKGHEDSVLSAQFSPNGHSIATASYDQTARIWNAESGEPTHVLKGHEGSVNSAQFSPDGKAIATASSDNTARIWNAKSGEPTLILKGHEYWVKSAQFSPDGISIVTASYTARIWNTHSGKQTLILKGHKYYVRSAQFSPDGKAIATASRDKTARIWNAHSGKATHILNGHEGWVLSAQFSPDGKAIATASRDHTARIWNAHSGKTVGVLKKNKDRIFSVQCSPDGSSIATAHPDNPARIWSAASNKQTHILKGHERVVLSAQFSPDGKSIATANGDKTARVWNAHSGKQTHILKGHGDWVRSAQFSTDGISIVTASDDRTARIWNAHSGKTTRILKGHERIVLSAQFSPDGNSIATASGDKTARVWNAHSGKQTLILKGHESGVNSAQFSPDGNSITTASRDKTARIWDAYSGKPGHILKGHENYVNSALFSPDGNLIATASDDHTVRIWDAATGKERQRMDGFEGNVSGATFSPTGKTIIAGGSRGRLEYRDPATGKALLYRVSFGENMNLAWTPEGLFDGDPEAVKFLYFWEPGTTRLYAASDLRKEYHNPKAILDILNEKF